MQSPAGVEGVACQRNRNAHDEITHWRSLQPRLALRLSSGLPLRNPLVFFRRSTASPPPFHVLAPAGCVIGMNILPDSPAPRASRSVSSRSFDHLFCGRIRSDVNNLLGRMRVDQSEILLIRNSERRPVLVAGPYAQPHIGLRMVHYFGHHVLRRMKPQFQIEANLRNLIIAN